jgi:thiosulfate/3-mercaptopyruvate sulfurtransferase
MLRAIGQDAAVLDGGLAGAEGPLETGWPTIDPVARTARPWPTEAVTDADGVVAHVAAGGVVADSRSAARYHGEAHPLDTASGHVPGAISLPFDGAVTTGRFADPDALRARYEAAGVDGDAVFYCGSGVSACVNVLAVEHAGLGRPRLYVGSWSGWTAEPDRPIER